MYKGKFRSGAEYIESLDDGRFVYVDGEVVDNVASHPDFRPPAESVAQLYDVSEDVETLTCTYPDDHQQHLGMWKIPRTAEDLHYRRIVHQIYARYNYGHMGRTPDHVASTLTAFEGNRDIFGRGSSRYAENVHNFYLKARNEDLYVAYAIVPPQVDRSKPAHQQPEPFIYAGVSETRDDGIVVRGASVLSTGAVIADWLLLTYIVPLAPGDDDYAISCVMPMNAPGLRLYPRKPYTRTSAYTFDNPLSSRFDESDSFVVLDDVLVPWENVFVYRSVDLTRDQFQATGAHLLANFQALSRFVVKLQFACGLAGRLSELHGIDKLPPIRTMLGGGVATVANQIESLVVAAETMPVQYGDLAIPNPRFVYTGMALQRQLIVDVSRSLRELAGASFVARPADARSFKDPRVMEDVARYYRSATAGAEERVKLLNLMWDFVGTEFAGRQLQYEMFYSAAQHISDDRIFRCYDWDAAKALVDDCLRGYELPARDSAKPDSVLWRGTDCGQPRKTR